MAFPTLARRLYGGQTHRLLFLINYSTTSSPFLPHARPIRHLSREFHRTFLMPACSRYFSTFPSFPGRNLDERCKFNDDRVQKLNDPVLHRFLELLKRVVHMSSEAEAMAALEESGIEGNRHLVHSAVWTLRDRWRLSYLVFKWGERRACIDKESCNLMVWILGNHQKFNTAWCLIREMHGTVMDTQQAMLILIDRYASSNEPGKAIWTFNIMEKFRLTPDQEAFHALLNSLCNYGNVEEAEEFMLVNKKLFPLETESFNIILNGWCNVSVDVFEAKRVWRDMSAYCISPDATSYTHMISCFSKVGNLFDSLRLCDEMKKRGWVPGLTVYNSLIHVLTQEGCYNEALKILTKIQEVGLRPNSATYNSMVLPLCRAKRVEEARDVLAMMKKENVSPTVETYHAFLESMEFGGMLEVLNQMRKAGLGPSEGTYEILLSKLFKSEQPENALKIWKEMKLYRVSPNSAHYSILIEGLAKRGLILKARKFYYDMESTGLVIDPKLKKLLRERKPKVRSNSKANFPWKQSKGDKVVHQKGITTGRKVHGQ